VKFDHVIACLRLEALKALKGRARGVQARTALCAVPQRGSGRPAGPAARGGLRRAHRARGLVLSSCHQATQRLHAQLRTSLQPPLMMGPHTAPAVKAGRSAPGTAAPPRRAGAEVDGCAGAHAGAMELRAAAGGGPRRGRGRARGPDPRLRCRGGGRRGRRRCARLVAAPRLPARAGAGAPRAEPGRAVRGPRRAAPGGRGHAVGPGRRDPGAPRSRRAPPRRALPPAGAARARAGAG